MSVRIFNLILGLVLLPLMVQAQTMVINSEMTWQGRMELSGPVQITASGVLTISAGTQVKILDPSHNISVQGQLFIDGTPENPVVFDSVKAWQGISFIESRPDSHILFAQFSDCAQALGIIATSPLISNNRFTNCEAAVKLLRESNAEIIDNHFVENGLGLGIEMRSSPRVAGNRFIGHKKSGISASNSSRGLLENNHFEKNEQGIGIYQPYPDKIIKNTFVENKVALYCYQTQNSIQIEENLFLNNEYGLVNFSFSFPSIKNNRFLKNKTAIQNDQFGSALVENNLFESNDTAIYNNRKSNPKINMNKFVGNKLGLFIDYSSYPLVRNNNFEKTVEGARLGVYQSADWEKRSGSKQLVMKNAQDRGSKNAMLGQAPTKYQDIVDLSENWWGEKTASLNSDQNNPNSSFFYDRMDKPTVTYEGFGPDSYRLDEIRFLPVLSEPVANAGPQP